MSERHPNTSAFWDAIGGVTTLAIGSGLDAAVVVEGLIRITGAVIAVEKDRHEELRGQVLTFFNKPAESAP